MRRFPLGRARALARDRLLRWFFRHRRFRTLAAASPWPRGEGRAPYDLSHLRLFRDTTLGPVQRDEALLLFGLARTIRPQTVVEFGFLQGHSALNFLAAMDADARLFSFDVTPRAQRNARERLASDPRFRFRLKSQTDITAEDLEQRPADLVFLDSAHDLHLNQALVGRLLPLLAADAIIAVHDTGTVPRALFPDWHWLLRTEEGWVGGEYEGEPGERAFVNWMLTEHPQFAQIHLHSRQVIRCGLTLLQRSASLPRPPGAADGP